MILNCWSCCPSQEDENTIPKVASRALLWAASRRVYHVIRKLTSPLWWQLRCTVRRKHHWSPWNSARGLKKSLCLSLARFHRPGALLERLAQVPTENGTRAPNGQRSVRGSGRQINYISKNYNQKDCSHILSTYRYHTRQADDVMKPLVGLGRSKNMDTKVRRQASNWSERHGPFLKEMS